MPLLPSLYSIASFLKSQSLPNFPTSSSPAGGCRADRIAGSTLKGLEALSTGQHHSTIKTNGLLVITGSYSPVSWPTLALRSLGQCVSLYLIHSYCTLPQLYNCICSLSCQLPTLSLYLTLFGKACHCCSAKINCSTKDRTEQCPWERFLRCTFIHSFFRILLSCFLFNETALRVKVHLLIL